MKKEPDNKKRKKPNRTKYLIDEYIGRGAKTQFVILLCAFVLFICVCGLLISLIEHTWTLKSGMWQTLLYLLDQGSLAEENTLNQPYILTLLGITLSGMVLTGAIVAIISAWLDAKLADLKKGASQVVEKGHTIIIGYNSNIFKILSELAEANKNTKGSCIVVIDNKTDKETMDHAIKGYFSENPIHGGYMSRIVCRSGDIVMDAIYAQVLLEEAGSVIINQKDDFTTIKIMLVVDNYLMKKGHKDDDNKITTKLCTVFYDMNSKNAVQGIIEHYKEARTMYFEESLARIMANVCRQPGLSLVFREVFSYSGNELYIEDGDRDGHAIDLDGSTFEEVIPMFRTSILVGIERQIDGRQEFLINPDGDMRISKGDNFIHLADDDNSIKIEKTEQEYKEYNMKKDAHVESKKINMLVLNRSITLASIISDLADFVDDGSRVHVVSQEDCDEHRVESLNHEYSNRIETTSERVDDLYNFNTVKQLIYAGKYSNILILSEDGLDDEAADSKTALLLLHIRRIIDESQVEDGLKSLVITSEMNIPDNQRLLSVANADDFIIGSELTNSIMAQVSNEPLLGKVYLELLDIEGSELYLRNAEAYIDEEESISFDELSRRIYAYDDGHDIQHEIALGYMSLVDGRKALCLNPNKETKLRTIQSTANNNATGICKVVVLSKGYDDFITKEKRFTI